MTELLLEFFGEEIPARMQAQACEDLKCLFQEHLTKLSLEVEDLRAYVTPRRLCLIIKGLPVTQEDRFEERKGPRTDAAPQAIEGFLKSTGLTLDRCERRETPKGTFFFATLHQPGQATKTLLPQVIRDIVFDFPWPKSMRWNKGTRTWVRPLHSGICLFEGEVLSFKVSLGEEDTPKVSFSDQTQGHRFLSSGLIRVKSFADYRQKLHEAHVILDQTERREEIRRQVQKLAGEKGLKVHEDPGLLDEVTGLVEWPQAYLGTIDRAFMNLPREVLITSMRIHQRYFALEDAKGNLAPSFIVVANTIPLDGGEKIVQGNERVLRARLSDAQYFYALDRKKTLEEHGIKLKDIIFHEKLGTYSQKVSRLERLARTFAPYFEIDVKEAEEAARIVKSDLVTEMVGEFPELQGVMGRYYALHEGKSSTVAAAISEHYSPKGQNDSIPASSLGQLLALVDRVDTLTGFFAVGIKPTGSKDPFALRRSALGVLRILEGRSRLKSKTLFEAAYDLYEDIFKAQDRALSKAETLEALEEFLIDRLKVYWRDQGLRHDYISAAFAVGHQDSVAVLKQRVSSLQDFLKGTDGSNLLAAYRRASNIVRIEEQKDKVSFEGQINPSLLQEKSERVLYDSLMETEGKIEAALAHHQFEMAMDILASLRPAVDQYFEDVLVNAEDTKLRLNRLNTLAFIKATLEKVADFKQVEER